MMKRSKKGTWILEDERYQYLAWVDKAEIVPIIAYQKGFKSIIARVSKHNSKKGAELEFQWPSYHFKEISWSTKEEVMLYLIKEYTHRKPISDDVRIRLEFYENHLRENYPEMLI